VASTIAIKRGIAELICEYSKNAYPNEFGAMLRIRDNVIEDLLFYPKSISGRSSLSVYEWEIPMGLDYDGTVHSHPSSSNLPSRQDVEFFAAHKRVHLIVAYPFGLENIAAYINTGEKIELQFID